MGETKSFLTVPPADKTQWDQVLKVDNFDFANDFAIAYDRNDPYKLLSRDDLLKVCLGTDDVDLNIFVPTPKLIAIACRYIENLNPHSNTNSAKLTYREKKQDLVSKREYIRAFVFNKLKGE